MGAELGGAERAGKTGVGQASANHTINDQTAAERGNGIRDHGLD